MTSARTTFGAIAAVLLTAGIVTGGCSSSSGARTTGQRGGGSHGAGWVPASSGATGVTDSTIQIGVFTEDPTGSAATFKQLGANQAGLGQLGFSKAAQAVADYINAHGGIAGRKLQLIFHLMPLQEMLSSSTEQVQFQAACTDWTQDHHVFAMIPFAGQPLSCATDSNTPFVTDFGATHVFVSDQQVQKYPDLWYGINYPTVERRGKALVDGLWQEGFFQGATKVALMVDGKEGTTAKLGVKDGILPELAQHGIAAPEEVVYPFPTEAPWQTYVLRLESEGVNRIIWSSSDDLMIAPLMMQKAAAAQHYTPRWGLASDEGLSLLGAFGAPKSEVEQTEGIGWFPELDNEDPNHSGSPTAQVCKSIGTASGQPGPVSYFCEPLLFLQYALDRAKSLSTAGLAQSVDNLGQSYVSAETLGGVTSFGPGKRDGVVSYSDITFNSSCTSQTLNCFEYSGPVTPFPS
jgi:hypothetical protein